MRGIQAALTRGLRHGVIVAAASLALALSAGVGAYFVTGGIASGATPAFAANDVADDVGAREPMLQQSFALDSAPSEPAEDDAPPVSTPTAKATPDPAPEPARASPTIVASRAAPEEIPAASTVPEPRVAASRLDTDIYSIVAAAFPEEPDKAYRVVLCESGGNPAINTGNGYYGMWQFDLPTWQGVGGAGLPSNASAEEQTARARMLYERKGWQPWGCR